MYHDLFPFVILLIILDLQNMNDEQAHQPSSIEIFMGGIQVFLL